MEAKIEYSFICSDESLEKVRLYKAALIAEQVMPGKFLSDILKGKNLAELTDEQFIECLVQTKPDQLYAEGTNFKANENWNSEELSILGDISCVIPTQAYDDGTWSSPKVHEKPLDVTLIYVPGPLLEVGFNADGEKPDFNEVCPNNKFNDEAYYRMIERRLLPGFLHVNTEAHKQNKELIVTIPGIGCGQFAGTFQNIIHNKFQSALERLLEEHGQYLTNIRALWYDNFDKNPSTKTINNTDFLVRPLRKGGLPQLCAPKQYGEQYANCELVSFVAWDPVSKPGNDYWGKSRATDDGVKAAATGTMPVLTGKEGVYIKDRMVPKEAPSESWSTHSKKTLLKVEGNFNCYNIPESKKTTDYTRTSDEIGSNQPEAKTNDNSIASNQHEPKPQKEEESILSRELIIGAVAGAIIGLIIIGILAIPPIGPAILSLFTATLGLTALATGLSLTAIGLGIVGVLTGFGAGLGALVNAFDKPETLEEQKPLLNIQDSTSIIQEGLGNSPEVKNKPWSNPIINMHIDSVEPEERLIQVKNYIKDISDSFLQYLKQKYKDLIPLHAQYDQIFNGINQSHDKNAIEKQLNDLESKANLYGTSDKLTNDTKNYLLAVRDCLKLLDSPNSDDLLLDGDDLDNNDRFIIRW